MVDPKPIIKSDKEPSPEKPKLSEKVRAFVERKWGASSWPMKILGRFFPEGGNPLDGLTQLKKEVPIWERVNVVLMLALIVILYFSWKNDPALFGKVKQFRNDLKEQQQVVEMEKKNNAFLEKLANDRNRLTQNIHTVYSAVPNADEKAEEVIAMLEDMAAKNRMVINAIGIRPVTDTQFYYDDLVGLVQPYEYSFAVESGLPNILSFIGSLRSSLRLMDIMSMEIEEGKDTYKASFTVFAYNILGDTGSKGAAANSNNAKTEEKPKA